MGITVKDAMKIGVLANAKLIAGANGLDREIEHVTMMEVPEAVQWLKGKDLVLANNFALAKLHTGDGGRQCWRFNCQKPKLY